MILSPGAPAFAQEQASSLILPISVEIEGLEDAIVLVFRDHPRHEQYNRCQRIAAATCPVSLTAAHPLAWLHGLVPRSVFVAKLC